MVVLGTVGTPEVCNTHVRDRRRVYVNKIITFYEK